MASRPRKILLLDLSLVLLSDFGQVISPSWVSLLAQMEKSLLAMQETWVQPLGQEDPLEKRIATHPVFFPGKSHGQRSLLGYSPWGHKESGMTE